MLMADPTRPKIAEKNVNDKGKQTRVGVRPTVLMRRHLDTPDGEKWQMQLIGSTGMPTGESIALAVERFVTRKRDVGTPAASGGIYRWYKVYDCIKEEERVHEVLYRQTGYVPPSDDLVEFIKKRGMDPFPLIVPSESAPEVLEPEAPEKRESQLLSEEEIWGSTNVAGVAEEGDPGPVVEDDYL